MAILRKHLSRGFTTIPNETLRDPRLSYKATGILAVLLSHSDGWNISTKSMSNGKTDGVASVRTGYTELEEAGYLKRVTSNDENGLIMTTIHVSDVSRQEWLEGANPLVAPGTGFPTSVNPTSVKPTPDNLSSIEEQEVENHNRRSSDSSFSRTSEIEAPRESTEIVPTTPSGQPSLSVVKAEVGNEVDVFDAWVAATGRDPRRTKFTPDRKSKVRARMRDGYTVEELIQAVRGVMLSSWHTGDNPDGKTYTELNLIMRNGSYVEKFRDLYLAGGEQKPDDQMTRVLKLLDGSGAFGGGQRELRA